MGNAGVAQESYFFAARPWTIHVLDQSAPLGLAR